MNTQQDFGSNFELNSNLYLSNLSKSNYLSLCRFWIILGIITYIGLSYMIITAGGKIEASDFYIITIFGVFSFLGIYHTVKDKVVNEFKIDLSSNLIEIKYYCFLEGFNNYYVSIKFSEVEFFERKASQGLKHKTLRIFINQKCYIVDEEDFSKSDYEDIKAILVKYGKDRNK